MSEPMSCCPAGGYCDRCDLLVGLDGLRVIEVVRDEHEALTVTVDRALPSPAAVGAAVGCACSAGVAKASTIAAAASAMGVADSAGRSRGAAQGDVW